MATILKKVGLKIVEFDVETDELVAGTLKLGGDLGTSYTSTDLEAIGTNTITADQAALDVIAAQSSADAAAVTADDAALDVITAQGTADSAATLAQQGVDDAAEALTAAGFATDAAYAAHGVADDAVVLANDAQADATLALSDSATNTASIDALASAASYGTAASVITATPAPLEGGTIDLASSGLIDDDIPQLLAADLPLGSRIIFDGGTAPVVGRVKIIAGEVLTIEYVGVEALAIDKLYHVKYNLLATSGSEEVRTIYAMEAIDAAMVKVADEIWDSASGIGLGSFTSGAGPIDASDTVLSAIQKLDGNITASSPDLTNYFLVDGSKALTGNLIPSTSTVNLGLTSDPFYYTYSTVAMFQSSNTTASINGRIDGSTLGVFKVSSEQAKLLLLAGGASSLDGSSGSVELLSSHATYGGASGDVSIYSGNSEDADAGNVTISAGKSSGTGTDGKVIIKDAIDPVDPQDPVTLAYLQANGPDLSTVVTKGGDADGAELVIGTTDAQDVVIEREGIPKMVFRSAYTELTTAGPDPFLWFAGSIEAPAAFKIMSGAGENAQIESRYTNLVGQPDSGDVTVRSGTASREHSGFVYVETGSGKLGSGELIIETGDSTDGNTGAISITTGASTSLISGNITINTGTGGTKGQVIIKDAIDPVDPQDVVTLAYLEANASSPITELVATDTIAAGDLCFLDATGQASLVIADGTQDREAMEMIFYSVAAVAIGATGEFIAPRVDLDLLGTVGAVMYLDQNNPGKMVDKATRELDDATDTDVVMLGRFISASVFHFAPKYLMTN